ncbi:uncharacterized protein Pyn_09761 [Prunus yedoensis var. nudiflora]|uniref:Cytochrome P450 CYP749A22-like n=1 Tax=Prunus yedoensis var. nudiflora TaxID=2094558 RepID=A0A314XIC8_PRUYE|nr:uncharacterized protein Pyn_09761 [Prunus yedoensis var. nudiflora]
MTSLGGLIVILSSFLCLLLVLAFIKILHKLWWTPIRIQKLMALQGIKGPSYRFIHGNTKEISNMKKEAMARPQILSHDILSVVQPHIHSWTKIYGKNYLQWHGCRAQLVITEPELCKEILNNKDRVYQKREPTNIAKKLLGDGLVVTTEAEKWAKLRKLATHAFHGESLKSMIPEMVASAESMLERWTVYEGKEIEVYEEFRLFTSEVISRTAFGSSYVEGRDIFEMLMKLGFLIFKNFLKVRVPGISKFFKTRDEIESEKLEKGIHASIIEMVKKRETKTITGENDSFGSDFLGLLLKANHEANENQRISVQELIDECKTFYFAGQETTNTLLAWTVFLLALHTDWQEEARKEVLQLFGKQTPNLDGIGKLKTMSMIINEALRLYPPAVSVVRNVEREVRLGKLIVPSNLDVVVSIVAVHHDPQIWGQDVQLFKPERFSEGVAKATNNNVGAFLPFSMGPRTCVGLNFAITEAKIALSMILQRYAFTLSPGYVHLPLHYLTVRPQHGVQGIKGPAYRLVHGNTKEIFNMQNESHGQAHKGKNFFQWYGLRPQLIITEPELCKEILNDKDRAYTKSEPKSFVKQLLGDGLVTTTNTEKWVKLRKVANYAFHGESLKSMTPATIASAEIMLERWKNQDGKEIEMFEEFRLLTSEVISRTAFGSSYLEGEKIFEMLMKLALLSFENSLKLRIPGISDEIESENLEKGAHHDANDNQRISVDDLVDECKTFYFGGQETSNSLLAWTVFLLAIHTDWQEEEKEVLEIFGKHNPNTDGIARLKTMTMIINETLRLYPPVVALEREAEREVRLGNLIIPATVELVIPCLAFHHEPEFWGQDVHLFKPERFSEGVAKATKNNTATFLPFGMGPRNCVGLNFATNEVKIVLSMILQRYSFTLSPAYVHSPFRLLTVRPQHGLQVMLHSL